MSALMETPPDETSTPTRQSPIERWNALPAFIRYAVYAAIGL